MLLALRIVTLVLAVLGAAGQLVLGLKWRSDAIANKELIAFGRALHKELREENIKQGNTGMVVESDEKLRKLEQVLTATPYLLVGALMAVVGGVLAMLGKPGCGVVWLTLAQLGPAILAVPSMIFSCFLPISIIVCGIACFVPPPKPKARRDDSDDRRDRRRDDRDDYDDRRDDKRDYDDRRDDDRRDRRRD